MEVGAATLAEALETVAVPIACLSMAEPVNPSHPPQTRTGLIDLYPFYALHHHTDTEQKRAHYDRSKKKWTLRTSSVKTREMDHVLDPEVTSNAFFEEPDGALLDD